MQDVLCTNVNEQLLKARGLNSSIQLWSSNQSVCSFGNIAGDGSEVRDHEIQQRTIKLLLRLIKPETSVN